MFGILLHGIVWGCMELHCIRWYCIVLYGITWMLNCMVISTFKMHCIVFIGFAWQCNINWWNLRSGFRGRGNKRKWEKMGGHGERVREIKSEWERDASALFCCTTVKYYSVLSQNVRLRYFLSQNVKIWYFLSQNVKINYFFAKP